MKRTTTQLKQRLEKFNNLEELNDQLGETVASTISFWEKRDKMREIRSLLRIRLLLLKSNIAHLQSKLQQIHNETMILSDQSKKTKQKHSSFKQHNDHLSVLGEVVQQSYRSHSTQNTLLLKRLSEHRKYLIAELLSFFPLNPISETECFIVNIKLPNLYRNWISLPSEVSATALGYIAHLLKVIPDYLNISLPFSVLPFGSRSMIWKEGSTKQYLLYNNLSEDFQVALDMLNWNVIHLCLSQGVAVSVDKHEETIPNILTMLRSQSLGSEIVQIEVASNEEEDFIMISPTIGNNA